MEVVENAEEDIHREIEDAHRPRSVFLQALLIRHIMHSSAFFHRCHGQILCVERAQLGPRLRYIYGEVVVLRRSLGVRYTTWLHPDESGGVYIFFLLPKYFFFPHVDILFLGNVVNILDLRSNAS
jgi:hypothetical protein